MSLIRVRYNGVADVRRITVAEFESVGVHVDRDVTWDIRNRFTVTLEAGDRMEEVLREQGHFSIAAQTLDLGLGEVISLATDAGNEGDILVDGTTGDSTPAMRKTPKP